MRAYGERIVVLPITEGTTIKGIQVSTEKVFTGICEVYCVGADVKTDIKKGDRIKIISDSGVKVSEDGVDYIVIVGQNILCYL